MWTLAGIRIGKNNLGADLETRADSFSKWIGRLHRHIDRAIFLRILVVGVEHHRHLRQTRYGPQIRFTQSSRQLERNHLRSIAQERPAHFNGELKLSGNNREVCEAPALEAARVAQNAARIRKWKAGFFGHTAEPLRQASR